MSYKLRQSRRGPSLPSDFEDTGTAAALIAAHEAAADPHPGYLTEDEADAIYLTEAQADALYAALSHGHAISDVSGLQTALDAKEPTITAGTTAQVYRGDKTFTSAFTGPFTFSVTGATTNVQVNEGESTVGYVTRRASANLSGPEIYTDKARATLASPAIVASGDRIGDWNARAHDGSAYITTGIQRFSVQAGTPSNADLETWLQVLLAPPASVTPTEVARFNHVAGFSMFGANVVIDENRLFRLRQYTAAGLPAAGTAGRLAYRTTGTVGPVYDDGSAWQAFTGVGGSLTVDTVEVDFTTPATGRFFDVALPGTTAGQKVLASVSIEMPAGVAEDELEMDPLVVYGHVTTDDEVRLFVGSVNGGLLGGKRNINVTVA